MSKYSALLIAVTKTARECTEASERLEIQVGLCCKHDVPRYLVFKSIVNAGWTEARARVVVSTIYCRFDKRVRAKGAGRKTSGHALRMANYAVKFMGSRRKAVPVLLAAYRHLRNSVTK